MTFEVYQSTSASMAFPLKEPFGTTVNSTVPEILALGRRRRQRKLKREMQKMQQKKKTTNWNQRCEWEKVGKSLVQHSKVRKKKHEHRQKKKK